MLLYYRYLIKIRIFYWGKVSNRRSCSGLEMSERVVLGFLFYLIWYLIWKENQMITKIYAYCSTFYKADRRLALTNAKRRSLCAPQAGHHRILLIILFHHFIPHLHLDLRYALNSSTTSGFHPTSDQEKCSLAFQETWQTRKVFLHESIIW